MDTRPGWTFRWWDARLLLLSVPLGLVGFEFFTQRVDYAGWPPLFGFPLPWMRWAGSSLEYLYSPGALAVDVATFQAAAYLPVSAGMQALQRRYRLRARPGFVVGVGLCNVLLGVIELAWRVLPLALGFHPLTAQQPVLGPPPGQEADYPLRGRRFGTAAGLEMGTYDSCPE
jgi:hypothetical protein